MELDRIGVARGPVGGDDMVGDEVVIDGEGRGLEIKAGACLASGELLVGGGIFVFPAGSEKVVTVLMDDEPVADRDMAGR